MGQTAVSDNQSSSVTLNELANKARKIYCDFEFQRRSHTMTEIDLNRAQITIKFPFERKACQVYRVGYGSGRIW